MVASIDQATKPTPYCHKNINQLYNYLISKCLIKVQYITESNELKNRRPESLL